MKSIDDDQFEQLVSALPLSPAGRRDRVLLAVMFDAGLRCDEALALLPSDPELRGDGDFWIHVRHGKGRRERGADAGEPSGAPALARSVSFRLIPSSAS